MVRRLDGRPFELGCGAKIFVHRHDYDRVVDAVSNGKLDLGGSPKSVVIVAADFEEFVTNAVATISSSREVKQKQKKFRGHAFLEDPVAPDYTVSKTFIDDFTESVHTRGQLKTTSKPQTWIFNRVRRAPRLRMPQTLKSSVP